jgi:hypothetical protein
MKIIPQTPVTFAIMSFIMVLLAPDGMPAFGSHRKI